MTISTTANRASYVGNGVTTVFPFAPPFVANSDLVVTETIGAGTPTLLVLNTDYTVTGAGSSSGGTVTRLVATANGTVLLIVRAVPFTQGSTWPNGTAFDGPTVEAAFDRAVMLVDQVSDRLDQAVLGTISANASAIANAPAGNIAAINVQNALNELDTEKAALAGAAFTGVVSVVDGNFSVKGSADATKSVKFEVDGLTAGAQRILTPPDRDITLNNLNGITASLGADVALNNTGNYFDGPSVAQGTLGTWFASGTVTLSDTAGAASFNVKLWDGATVIASGRILGGTSAMPVSLSGIITSPAGNIRISVQDPTAATGKILFNASGNSKDSTITAVRVA